MKPCSLARFTQLIQQRGKSAGALRFSYGIANHFADLQRVLAFAARLCDQTTLTLGESSRDFEDCRVVHDGAWAGGSGPVNRTPAPGRFGDPRGRPLTPTTVAPLRTTAS